MPVIIIQNLHKEFNGFKAVDGLDLTVNKGDVYGFLGPNGAGKSTTIRMLVNLIAPTSGSISIFERNYQQHRNYILSRIGCIVEKPDFYTYLTAEENLNLFAKISGIHKSKKELHQLLEHVGLQNRFSDKVKTFSHGMKQRLGIAQALLNDPELIILDEPTTGLDPQGIIDIRNMILQLSREHKKTILLSSHILSEIELISNRMVIINKGKVVTEGNVNALLSSQNLLVTFILSNVNSALKLLNESSFSSNIKSTGQNEIILQIDKQEIAAVNRMMVQNEIDVTEISFKRPLEELFLQLTSTPMVNTILN